MGGEACAWEFGNYEEYPFYRWGTPSLVALFGDKLWAGGEREYDGEYQRALSELLFGREEFCEVFSYVGALIPPRRKGRLCYLDKESLKKEALLSCASHFRDNGSYPAASRFADLLCAIAKEL